jgi:serine/threonine protein kinase
VHTKKYIHRDLKPENFLIGLGKNEGMIYLIDYGTAKKYIKSDTGGHIKERSDKKFIGVARYASLNCHKGLESSRRDDLEAIGYILIYLLKGSLPWQGIELKPGEPIERAIYRKKLEITVEELCLGLPKEFNQYLAYCRSLEFTEDPDYDYLIKLFESIQSTAGYSTTTTFIDWSPLKKGKVFRI